MSLKNPVDVLPKGATGFLIYTCALVAAAAALPPAALNPGSAQFIVIIGVLAMWRYSWGLFHYVRHLVYNKIVFPKMRAKATLNSVNLMPSHVYLLMTSFRIETETTVKVYEAAFREADRCGIPVTIIASIVELSEEFLIKDLFRKVSPNPSVNLTIVRVAGTGKRDGLAQGFRAISRAMPAADAIVAVIDGDSILEENLIQKCVPFFKMYPNLGALTTDEACEVKGSRIIREWHDLRFAQRQILMASVSLSKKVLTLTGRMSMFRAEIITNPEFIAQVQNDSINHWRLGRFKFLTGDDKSSWYHVLKDGWDMIYIPDTLVMTVEHPPSPNFFKATTQLMFRWFGNMLRTNGRALALGPQKVGLFTWWCILDQRISMWTSLTGPVLCLLLAVKHGLAFIPIYLVWIGFTRWVMSLMLLASRPVLSWYYPFLIYYNQVWGSLIKTYVFFRLDRQSWTRQKTKLNRGLNAWQGHWQNLTSFAVHATALFAFVAFLGLISGLMTIPPSTIAKIVAFIS